MGHSELAMSTDELEHKHITIHGIAALKSNAVLSRLVELRDKIIGDKSGDKSEATKDLRKDDMPLLEFLNNEAEYLDKRFSDMLNLIDEIENMLF